MDLIYRFVPGPLCLIIALYLCYDWLIEGTSSFFFGLIPSPIFIIILLFFGGYLIKLDYIDGDIEKIKFFFDEY